MARAHSVLQHRLSDCRDRSTRFPTTHMIMFCILCVQAAWLRGTWGALAAAAGPGGGWGEGLKGGDVSPEVSEHDGAFGTGLQRVISHPEQLGVRAAACCELCGCA